MALRRQITAGQVSELEAAREKNRNKNVERRLSALLMYAAGSDRGEIARETGYAKSYISELVSKYQSLGLEAVAENHYPGNRRNLSFAEEEDLLDEFRLRAGRGEHIRAAEIKAAYEKKVGHGIGGSQIYYVLRRHGWRKVLYARGAEESEMIWQFLPQSASD